MRRMFLYWLLAAVLVPVSCMQDPLSPENDVAEPAVGYETESLTRTSVILTGSYEAGSDITEYGFEMAEDSFGDGSGRTFPNPAEDGQGRFSCRAELLPGHVYNVRTYVTNGAQWKYSRIMTIKAPTTSVASLTDVSYSQGRISARVLDDGGTTVREVGFCWSEASEPEVIKRHKIPAVLEEDNAFSLDLSHFEMGKVYFFLAYAENSSQSTGEAFGYSLHPFELAVTDDMPVEIADPAFARLLIQQYDADRNGYISLKEIKGIKSLSLNTDAIADIGEIRMMPELGSLTCRGSSSGSGQLERLDLSGNPLLRQLDVSGNRLTQLDVSSCASLETLDATSCPQLQTICITPEQSVRAEGGYRKDAHTSFVLNPDSIIPIPDAHFRKYLVDRYDRNDDDRISVAEALAIVQIDVCTDDIETVSGIAFFANLAQLRCAGSLGGNGNLPLGRLCELDVSANTALTLLDCRSNPCLSVIWLKRGQEIERLSYDSDVTAIQYK